VLQTYQDKTSEPVLIRVSADMDRVDFVPRYDAKTVGPSFQCSEEVCVLVIRSCSNQLASDQDNIQLDVCI